MDKEKKLLTLLNGSAKVVGSKQVLRGLSEGTLRCVIVSEDANDELKNVIVSAAANARVEVLSAPSMEWLGENAGIKVGAAAVGLTLSEAVED